MKKLLFVIIITLSFHPSAWTQVKEIDALIKPYVQSNNFSGSILIAKNDKITFSKAYGLMKRSYGLQHTTQTKFYIASVSMILHRQLL